MLPRRHGPVPSLVSFLLWTTFARTLLWMVPIGLFFAAAADPATAAVSISMGSAITVGGGVALWPVGRRLDRVGAWRALRAALLLGAVGLAGVAVALALEAPTAVLLAGAAASGVALSPLVATPRALLTTFVAPARLPWASGMEATSLEVALIVSPVVAAALGSGGGVALLATAAAALVVVWLGFPRPADVRSTGRTRPAPMISPGVLRLAGLAALLGVSGGLVEPALAGLPVDLGPWELSPAALFVALGLGSAVGGLLAARSGWPRRRVHAVPLFTLHAAGLLAAVLTPGAGRVVALVIAGLPVAPLTSLAGLYLDQMVAPSRLAETFGVIASVLQVATGAGQGLAAWLLGPLGPSSLLVLAAALAAAAAVPIASGAMARREVR